MGRPYSLDLRERAVAFVAKGASRRAAARRSGVSESIAAKPLQHRERSGAAVPRRQGRPPGGGKLDRLEAERAEKDRAVGKAPKPAAMTLCVNSRGTAWTEDGFRSSFLRLIRKLETDEKVGSRLTFHGPRHTIGSLLKKDEASEEDIAIALGQKTIAMARHYSQEANRRTRMTVATLKFDSLPRNKAAP